MEAGAKVLAARLQAVHEHLQPAAERAHEDIEHVHQLRVATRRATAALQVFEDLLPDKTLRRTKVLLRTLRRAAGDARDWDVFAGIIEGSTSLAEPSTLPARDYLLGYANGHRTVAQLILQQVATERGDQLASAITALPDSLKQDYVPKSLGPQAMLAMTGLFEQFEKALASGPTSETALHQLRIQAKRIRYAMEIFAGCFAPQFREVIYPAVEELQSTLGTIQDSSVLSARLRDVRTWLRSTRPEVLRRIRPGLNGLTLESNQQVRSARVAFGRWSRQWVNLREQHKITEIAA